MNRPSGGCSGVNETLLVDLMLQSATFNGNSWSPGIDPEETKPPDVWKTYELDKLDTGVSQIYCWMSSILESTLASSEILESSLRTN